MNHTLQVCFARLRAMSFKSRGKCPPCTPRTPRTLHTLPRSPTPGVWAVLSLRRYTAHLAALSHTPICWIVCALRLRVHTIQQIPPFLVAALSPCPCVLVGPRKHGTMQRLTPRRPRLLHPRFLRQVVGAFRDAAAAADRRRPQRRAAHRSRVRPPRSESSSEYTTQPATLRIWTATQTECSATARQDPFRKLCVRPR